jgi:exonuclease V
VTHCVPSEAHERHNPIKRSFVASGPSPAKKKQCRSPSPSKQHTTFFPDKSIPEEARVPEQPSSEEEVHNTSLTGDSTPTAVHPQPTSYDLTLIDYKTRRAPSLPPEEDTVSSQLQLMLYHRLLSALLSPETFDFYALWVKLGINPHKSFSRSFVEDIGLPTGDERDLPELHVDLCSMVAAWISVVHAARSCGAPLRGISPELQIIYRKAGIEKNSCHNRQKKPDSANEAAENPLEALALQEELDIARAIEESLRPIDQEAGEASIVTRAILHNVNNTLAPQSKELAPDEVADLISPAPDDLELEWAVQDSLPAYTSNISDSKAQAITTREHEGSKSEASIQNFTY